MFWEPQRLLPHVPNVISPDNSASLQTIDSGPSVIRLRTVNEMNQNKFTVQKAINNAIESMVLLSRTQKSYRAGLAAILLMKIQKKVKFLRTRGQVNPLRDISFRFQMSVFWIPTIQRTAWNLHMTSSSVHVRISPIPPGCHGFNSLLQ